MAKSYHQPPISFCALFTRKFELFLNLKGRAAAAAVQPPPHLEFTLSEVEGSAFGLENF